MTPGPFFPSSQSWRMIGAGLPGLPPPLPFQGPGGKAGRSALGSSPSSSSALGQLSASWSQLKGEPGSEEPSRLRSWEAGDGEVEACPPHPGWG